MDPVYNNQSHLLSKVSRVDESKTEARLPQKAFELPPLKRGGVALSRESIQDYLDDYSPQGEMKTSFDVFEYVSKMK
jgi:hypothetical protein